LLNPEKKDGDGLQAKKKLLQDFLHKRTPIDEYYF
jgi:hypothetical protein